MKSGSFILNHKKVQNYSLNALLDNSSSFNNSSIEKATIKVNNIESIVEYVKKLPLEERMAVEGIYRRVLETVIMVMEK